MRNLTNGILENLRRLLGQGLGSRPLKPAELLARVDALRTRLRMRPWTLDELRQARHAGHE